MRGKVPMQKSEERNKGEENNIFMRQRNKTTVTLLSCINLPIQDNMKQQSQTTQNKILGMKTKPERWDE